MTLPTASYVVLVSLVVKAEYQEQFKTAILKNAAQSLMLEPACHVFDVAVSAGGREFCLYEVYRGREGFDAHLRTTHFLEFDELTQPWLENKTVQTFLRLKT